VSTAVATRRLSPLDDARLVPPQVREGVVPRVDLVHRLRPTARSTVALIVAPAGYGKTTLLTQAGNASGGRPLVWIGIDETDNDPLAFASCLTAAVERSGAVDVRLLRARSRAGDSHAVLLARLVKALKAGAPMTIAVDDLHLLKTVRSLKIVEAIANNLPPQSQLLLAARKRPRLGLTALRADGRLIELATADLRLSAAEGLQLLRLAGAEVSVEAATDLTARAEGWPAGLYLGALACPAGRGLSSFDGSDRFVSDYFDAEYLSPMDEDDRAFLVRVSVLEQLSGPLCDAVLRTSGSAARLERIARSNLFVSGVGSGQARVFRLHRMLREALAAELRRREPACAAQIARRAADWSERHGDLESTVDYEWAAGDHDSFAVLVGQAALPLFQTGHLETVERWLARLNPDLLERHPAAAVSGAVVHTACGRPDDADSWTAIAETAAPDTAMPDGTPSPEPWLAGLRAGMCRGGKDAMRRDAALALAGLAEGSPWRSSALMLLGVGQLLAGENAAADEILAEARMAAATTGCANVAAMALAMRSLLAAAEGRWDAAEDLASSARGVLHDARLENYPTSPATFAASARAAVHRSDWVRARNDLEHAREHLPPLAPGWFSVPVQLEATRVYLGLSERDRASSALAAAEQILAHSADLGVLHDQAAELRVALDRLTRRPAGGREQLTPAELRLLPLLTTHLTFREIGELLRISRNTVKTQAICTYRKLGVTSRSAAIERAIELGLVDRPGALDIADGRFVPAG
jgi:LuxR family transcriptional regulator, maltose regulon positive regulatory protein